MKRIKEAIIIIAVMSLLAIACTKKACPTYSKSPSKTKSSTSRCVARLQYMHIFLMPLEKIFVSIKEINPEKRTIKYHIRDKGSGDRIRPDETENYKVHNDVAHFGGYHLHIDAVYHISNILNS